MPRTEVVPLKPNTLPKDEEEEEPNEDPWVPFNLPMMSSKVLLRAEVEGVLPLAKMELVKLEVGVLGIGMLGALVAAVVLFKFSSALSNGLPPLFRESFPILSKLAMRSWVDRGVAEVEKEGVEYEGVERELLRELVSELELGVEIAPKLEPLPMIGPRMEVVPLRMGELPSRSAIKLDDEEADGSAFSALALSSSNFF